MISIKSIIVMYRAVKKEKKMEVYERALFLDSEWSSSILSISFVRVIDTVEIGYNLL